MVRLPRTACESNIYHVVVRGVNRCVIFETDADRLFFLGLLRKYVNTKEIVLLAWCLMGNHVHLLLQAEIDIVSTVMRGLLSEYALHFNAIQGRVGHLFQERFHSEPVTSDEYLLTVVRYIHRNPVKACISPTCDYPWSSYREYVGTPSLTDTSLVMGMFGDIDDFTAFHKDGENDTCLEGDPRTPRLTDERATAIACDELGLDTFRSLIYLPKGDRDAALVRLKDRGLSVRQIARLTGIGRGTVQKASFEG